MRLAYFISPHGFGHATRASAVMQALRARRPDVGFELFGLTPDWLFRQSLDRDAAWRLHRVETDVGLRQASALQVDLPATVAALDAFLPFDPELLERLAATVRQRGCRAVLCDVSPLGVEVARAAGLPSLLIENFTWDWIYQPMLRQAPGLAPAIERLREIYAGVSWRVQTRPVCDPRADAAVVAPPVSRRPRATRDEARAALGLPDDERAVLVTLGGMRESLDYLPALQARSDLHFVVTSAETSERRGNLRLFDNDTPLYMPDLIRAVDAVVAKLGYSTLAETWHEGRPLAWITRSGFRESPVLDRFAAAELSGFAVSDDAFRSGAWVDRLDELLALDGVALRPSRGADHVAEFVLARLE